MSTNYYWYAEPTCSHCGREYPNRKHIGKSAGGWTFSFRGYREPWSDPMLVSEDDWRRLIALPGSEIKDEYGRLVTVDGFWQMVDEKRSSPHNHAREYPHESWVDHKGNSFSSGEWS